MAVEQEGLLTIQQASELTGLTAHTLRYYERIDLLAVGRAPNGHRRYDQHDIERLLFLNYLRLTGMPLEQMKQYAALHAQDEAGIAERVTMLHAHRATVARQVEALQRMLEVIDYKLALLTNKATDVSEE